MCALCSVLVDLLLDLLTKYVVQVHRITNRLGWHKPTTTTPEQTRYVLPSAVSPPAGDYRSS